MLKQETLAHLQTPLYQFDRQIVPEASPYGFGWINTERPWGADKVLTHTGGNTTWFATIWLAPNKKAAFIAVVNSGDPDAGKACDEMAAGMIKYWSAKPRR
ncbi:MAG TPA: hypothetical protein PLR25_26405 [Planctomycetaceae bacterium]|nr:hypothetical protein [Planctomycetaceae bacterium]